MPDIQLLPLCESHLTAARRWMEDDGVRDGMLVDQEITDDSHRAWFRQLAGDDTQAIYAVLADGAHIGNFGYRNLSSRHRTGELWMLVGPEHQGRGFARPMLQAGLAEGFGAHGLRKIYLHVRSDNVHAIVLYARAGFCVEGLLRQEQLQRGMPVDVLRMALFRGPGAVS